MAQIWNRHLLFINVRKWGCTNLDVIPQIHFYAIYNQRKILNHEFLFLPQRSTFNLIKGQSVQLRSTSFLFCVLGQHTVTVFIRYWHCFYHAILFYGIEKYTLEERSLLRLSPCYVTCLIVCIRDVHGSMCHFLKFVSILRHTQMFWMTILCFYNCGFILKSPLNVLLSWSCVMYSILEYLNKIHWTCLSPTVLSPTDSQSGP